MARCGLGSTGDAAVVVTTQGVSLTGAIRCTRVLCPWCGPQRAREFASDLERLMRGWFKENPRGVAQHMTLTVRHTREEPVGGVVERLVRSRESWFRDGTVRRVLAAMGHEHFACATEVTWGWLNGSHPHNEVLLLLARRPTRTEARVLRERWAAISGADVDHGMRLGRAYEHAQSEQAASYLSKLMCEMSGSHKAAAKGHFTMSELVRRAANNEPWAQREVAALAVALHGRQFYKFSRKARALIESVPELEGPVEIARVSLEQELYRDLARASRSFRLGSEVFVDVLEVAELAPPEMRDELVRETASEFARLGRKLDDEWRAARRVRGPPLGSGPGAMGPGLHALAS
jgi:hypothetical protein